MPTKIKHLLQFRLLQIKRLIDSIGIMLLVVFLLCIFGILASLLAKLPQIDRWWSILALVVFFYSLIHHRNDKNFLASIFQDKIQLSIYYLIENLLLVLPVLAFQIWCNHTFTALSIIGVAILMSIVATFIPEKYNTSQKTSLDWIPLQYFELKFVVESRPYTAIIISIIGLLSFVHIGFFVFWAFLLINWIIVIFLPLEPIAMLHWKNKYVAHKIITYSKLLLITTLPIIVLALIKNIDKWSLILYILFCIWNTIFMSISLKYVHYNPLHAQRMNKSIESIMMLLMLLPGGALIVFCYNIYIYISAEKNLKSYYA